MRTTAWRLCGLALAGTMAAPVALLAFRDRCLSWGGGWPPPGMALAVVCLNLVIAAAYFGIPFELWRASRAGHLPIPWWLRAAFISYAAFILSCGVTHLERALTRPVVYCAESIAVLAVCATLSVFSWVGTRVTRPAIEGTLRLLGSMPVLTDFLGAMDTPEAAERLLRRVARGLRGDGQDPQ